MVYGDSLTVTMRSAPCSFLVLLLLSLSLCDAYPKSEPQIEDKDDFEQELEELWPLQSVENLAPREALQKMQKILGIRSQNEDLIHRKVPPQFMMELYNTIADSSGVTRGRNPYNARIVRSFVEKDPSLSHFYFFNISGLEMNESVLEAELHLYRKKTPTRNTMTSTSHYYLIRVYQVLDPSLDTSDHRKLLSVRYIGAHASGWQIFNVKQAVLGWMSGEPNLGFLVTAQNLFKDEITIEFSRRNDYHHSKQPILVLFDDDSDRSSGRLEIVPRYYAYENQDNKKNLAYEKENIDLENNYEDTERYRRRKRQQEDGGQREEVLLANRGELEFFQRQKRRRPEEEDTDETSRYRDLPELTRRHRRAATSFRISDGIVSNRRSRITRILTSMDIYERAMFRERLGQAARDKSARVARSTNDRRSLKNATECRRHDLYVDFHDIGLSSSIIAPTGYSAYQCKGVCEPPLSQDQLPTNHATIQAIVHKIDKDVGRPCCVPTKLLGTSILFYDDDENVVLKMYEDMIADRCGCR